jgi:predicted helicase
MTKNAEFYYFTLADDLPRKDKLHWFDTTKFKDITFERIHPDEKGNWLNLTDNDFESLMPLVDKNNDNTIFRFSSLGVSTNRDEWVYDFSEKNLHSKMQFFIKTYNELLANHNETWNEKIKWSRDLKRKFEQKKKLTFDKNLLKQANYRPFIKQHWYAEKILNDILTQNHYDFFGAKLDKENEIICFSTQSSSKPFQCLGINQLSDLHFLGDNQCLPLFLYDIEGNRHDNITNWALNQFKNRYACELTKTDIFHYVYAVLHNPSYREKYEQNLKREFPRVPFYDDFSQWVEWGKMLMDLHLNYETVEPYPLKRVDSKTSKLPKAKLKADKENGVIELDENTSLSGIPVEAWDYKLGNRSALEWILDQYKEKKPKDATIAEKFNVYHFSDYKESVIDLLTRVCGVSVETVKITKQMKSKDV